MLSSAASAARAVLAENASKTLMSAAINSCHARGTTTTGTATDSALETHWTSFMTHLRRGKLGVIQPLRVRR
ncbi:hypothetical protein D3C78_1778880 [compost metagenome]